MKTRLEYVDGLRGIAVLLVVFGHAWGWSVTSAWREGLQPGVAPVIDWMGGAGVSLFLVLSGFCLSLPYLKRRARGESGQVDVLQFLGRRCWRILPAYYAALALFIGLSFLLASIHLQLLEVGPVPSRADIFSHLLLVHNDIPAYATSIDGPFWSLGLEWQWYFLFPLLLFGLIRWPRRVLALSLVVGIFWASLASGDHTYHGSLVLPGRITEFLLGIGAAWIVTSGVRRERWVWWAGSALILPIPLWMATHGYVSLEAVRSLGLFYPFQGVGFASLVVLGTRSSHCGSLLSTRPLVWLGCISYSVYLIHAPFMNALGLLLEATHLTAWVATPLLTLFGVGCGALFYRCVEGPCLRRRFVIGAYTIPYRLKTLPVR